MRGYGVLLIICLVVAGPAVWREHARASAAERVALAHGLALHAAELRDDDPVRARDLGLAAVNIHADEQTRAGLIDTLVLWRRTDALDPKGVGGVSLSGDGRIALTGDTDGVGVWDLKTWLDPQARFIDKAERLAVLTGHKGDVNALTLSFDGRTALTGGDDGTTIVWNLADPSRPARLSVTKAHDSYVRDVRLSADGRTAVTGGADKKVTVWDLADPARPVERADLALPAGFAEATAMSSDGRTVVVANPDRADVWRLDDRTPPAHTAPLTLPPTDMYDVALTTDGETALMAGGSGTGFLWDLSDPSRPVRLAALKGYSQDVTSVALSADGRVALMASADRGVSLWDLSDLREIVADPAQAVCGQGRQTISRADWDRFAGGADWSDYGGDASDTLSVCAIR